MPTKYDVFAHIIQEAPIRAHQLPFNTPIYNHLKTLQEEDVIQETNKQYTPKTNQKTTHWFKIIKYCLKNNLDYNLLFSQNTTQVIQEINTTAPQLRPKTLTNNQKNTQILTYLEENQFILLTKKRPRQGILLKHHLLDELLALNNKPPTKTTQYQDVHKQAQQIHAPPINPYEDKLFAFLAGSAQLEGSTVNIGETRELLLRDIYPDKPKKDIQMVQNLNEATHYILEHLNQEITPQHIQEINQRVLFSLHRNAGKYKRTHNKIQGNPHFTTAHPQKVPQLITEYCKTINQLTNKQELLKGLGHAHNELQHIHPFSDGNSRTTRLVVSWLLLKHHLPLLVIKMGCFDEYMNNTKLARTRDDNKLNQLLTHLLVHEELLA